MLSETSRDLSKLRVYFISPGETKNCDFRIVEKEEHFILSFSAVLPISTSNCINHCVMLTLSPKKVRSARTSPFLGGWEKQNGDVFDFEERGVF